MAETNPQTASVGKGHDPERHLGSLKTPIYETSTFVFESAAAGKRYFEIVYGGAEPSPGEDPGYSYSRLDAPNLRVAEERLAYWEETEDALVFNAGMAAIGTLFLTLLRPGDVVIYSSPAYGGTLTLLRGLMTEIGVIARAYGPATTGDGLADLVGDDRLSMVYVETPANPTNDIYDIEMLSALATEHGAVTVVDNTFLSPVWQKPVRHGADLIVHSATKYLGGHSDLTAGVVCGRADLIERLRHTRYELGTTAQPATAWLLTRSLETLQIRVERQTATATSVAAFLAEHPKVETVSHLSLLGADDPRHDIFKRQCTGPGAMISFIVTGGEEAVFRMLDAMRVVRLAVSLGGTESLASHPWTMSHALMPAEEKTRIGVSPGLVRLSVGVESPDDLIADLGQALDRV
ncbi:MAG: aminotransferase class I/II-fold pyridoxal phosphate-dependent enzyme [Actinobacteria bacterium]|nr:aminotransferase class I/II-fold pyridoxal phosphate-dependent enzyme [Actinomycetota bacterium]